MTDDGSGHDDAAGTGAAAASPADASDLLKSLFDADRREHGRVPAVGTPEYSALRARDRERRARAERAVARLREAGGASLDDLYHAAWLFNHGDTPAEARRAHEWAREAAERGHGPARWLAAASYDRWRMYEGRPQKYGTQFVPDGVRYRLWELEPGTTDAERAAWDVPPLAEQERRAEEMTRREPQPPMEDAPEWLRSALRRWSREASHTAMETARQGRHMGPGGPKPETNRMDQDLEAMSRDELIEEARRLRNGIRAHRDSTGHDLCWHHPDLWALLPEDTDPLPVVPEWPEFLRGCIRYRQSLDDRLPDAPRSREPPPGSGGAA